MDGPLASEQHIQPLCILLSPFSSLEVDLSKAGYQPPALFSKNSLFLSDASSKIMLLCVFYSVTVTGFGNVHLIFSNS